MRLLFDHTYLLFNHRILRVISEVNLNKKNAIELYNTKKKIKNRMDCWNAIIP